MFLFLPCSSRGPVVSFFFFFFFSNLSQAHCFLLHAPFSRSQTALFLSQLPQQSICTDDPSLVAFTISASLAKHTESFDLCSLWPVFGDRRVWVKKELGDFFESPGFLRPCDSQDTVILRNQALVFRCVYWFVDVRGSENTRIQRWLPMHWATRASMQV